MKDVIIVKLFVKFLRTKRYKWIIESLCDRFELIN